MEKFLKFCIIIENHTMNKNTEKNGGGSITLLHFKLPVPESVLDLISSLNCPSLSI